MCSLREGQESASIGRGQGCWPYGREPDRPGLSWEPVLQASAALPARDQTPSPWKLCQDGGRG